MCAKADNGSTTANQTCIFTCCAQTYCATGSAFYYNLLTTCVCTANTCASACGAQGDYCNSAPNYTSTTCGNCLNKYFATGAACDSSPGTSIGNACQADSDCSAFNTCAGGCP